ncbi:lysophospholipid acyltransferase family protein [Sporomusa termitida]|uniref:Lipid A biosynthesis lauroyltransferase n=1 Tax=Sporomusa termitida TaxID=2377 RepID=A0A517DYW8_9FIRM|nr:lysophospholipid acyltransferase family protein [Sporomusa termitida]QDR82541.1 Lipid A biosynthesis lauroyltransferase [Sporomusa termitida]
MRGNLQYFFLKMLSRLICLLPYRLVCWLGRQLGIIVYVAAKRQRERGIMQVTDSLKLTQAEASALIRRMFCNLGQTVMEVLYTPALTPQNIRQYVSISGLEHLQKALSQGHGVVFLTAHMGNWEWMAAALCYAGFPITTIAKPQPNPQHTRILNEFRTMVGLEVFNRGTSDMIKAARALKKGKVLGFLADQDGGTDGVFFDFLGKNASSPVGPAYFAKTFKSVIVPAFTYHRPQGGHHVVIKPPVAYQHYDDPDQEIYHNTLQMTKVIEEAILAYPDEWIWFMRRWNTQKPAASSEVHDRFA